MRRLLPPVLAALLAAAATAGLFLAWDGLPGKGGSAHSYSVGFWGDLPYSDEQREEGGPNLIDDMNRSNLAFSVHAGDVKSGEAECKDDVYEQAEEYFEGLEAPNAYTPGDNEWTDCDRNPKYSSRERLDHVREALFDTDRSFGRREVRLEVQGPPEQPYTENRRWRIGRVTYATLHVVGSNNNLSDVAPDRREFEERNEATTRWMRETFEQAEDDNAEAVLLTAQANPGFDRFDPERAPMRDPRTLEADVKGPDPDGGDGFDEFLRELRDQAREFRRPVVLVTGDSHYFRVDKPLQDEEGRRIENLTRVEVPGDNPHNGNNDVQWVEILVDSREREVFSFRPRVVPDNRVAVPSP